MVKSLVVGVAVVLAWVGPSFATSTPFTFSTGNPDGKMATASRPDSGNGVFEIESADDFFPSTPVQINSATFTGILTGANPLVGQVVVEIYRVFPNDSDTGRTSGPPTFSTPNVPTRVNSPSDVALESRDSTGTLTFTTDALGPFGAVNSVRPGGIHPQPGQTTGGNGPVDGTEVQFGVTFTKPIVLPAGHYFFVPQVQVTGGDFLWLSAARPIVAPGTPFSPDLQSWTRDAGIDPDWLRVGTDIVGGNTPPTFNATFSLEGIVPEPGSLGLLLTGVLALGLGSASSRRRD